MQPLALILFDQDAVEKRDKLSQDVEDLDGKIAEKPLSNNPL